jgi:hypothetical protein
MKQACMGGWCKERETCEHYNAENRSDPVERLCSSVPAPKPIVVQPSYLNRSGRVMREPVE